MAHAARIEHGIVQDVIVIPDNLDATESDAAIEAYIHSVGLTGTWIRTSYNGNIRGCYAGIGYTFDADLDVFVAPIVEESEEVLELQPVVEISEPEA
jgi:hypothetical protein